MGSRPGRPRTDAGAPHGFAALADPTRRHLLAVLAGGERTVGELASGLEISQPAVSQHLRVLREAGLVIYARVGRCRRYGLCPGGLAELRHWLDELDRNGGVIGERRLDDAAGPDRPIVPGLYAGVDIPSGRDR